MIPYIHAENSARRYGGKPEDYLDIHELMDSSKAAFPNNLHRVLTHNSWFAVTILPKVFGHMRTNSDGKRYNVKDVGEYHILEDFRMQFIPSVQDYLENMVLQDWMNNGGGGAPRRCVLQFKNKKEAEAFVNRDDEKLEDIPLPTILPIEPRRINYTPGEAGGLYD